MMGGGTPGWPGDRAAIRIPPLPPYLSVSMQIGDGFMGTIKKVIKKAKRRIARRRAAAVGKEAIKAAAMAAAIAAAEVVIRNMLKRAKA